MDMEEKKLTADAAEQALPVQELPADIPAEVRQKLAEDLNEEATEDLKQDMREAEKEEANDEEVKANPEMLTKSRLLKLLIKKQYVKLREVTEEEQPADLAELLEELDENNRLVVFRLLKKEVATEAFAYMSDEARDDLVNAFSDVELVGAIEEMSLDDAADLLEDDMGGIPFELFVRQAAHLAPPPMKYRNSTVSPSFTSVDSKPEWSTNSPLSSTVTYSGCSALATTSSSLTLMGFSISSGSPLTVSFILYPPRYPLPAGRQGASRPSAAASSLAPLRKKPAESRGADTSATLPTLPAGFRCRMTYGGPFNHIITICFLKHY